MIYRILQFWDEGYLILPGFASKEEIDSMKNEIHRIVEEMNPDEHNTVFTTLEMKRVGDFNKGSIWNKIAPVVLCHLHPKQLILTNSIKETSLCNFDPRLI